MVHVCVGQSASELLKLSSMVNGLKQHSKTGLVNFGSLTIRILINMMREMSAFRLVIESIVSFIMHKIHNKDTAFKAWRLNQDRIDFKNVF